jgi:hypothetical protein
MFNILITYFSLGGDCLCQDIIDQIKCWLTQHHLTLSVGHEAGQSATDLGPQGSILVAFHDSAKRETRPLQGRSSSRIAVDCGARLLSQFFSSRAVFREAEVQEGVRSSDVTICGRQ